MSDPYAVLGVSPGASDEEIKRAYRELVRKYHPDNYHDNPLADLASEKMKEINEAYNALTKGSSGAYAYQSQSDFTGSSAGSANFAAVRSAIASGNLSYAETLLERETNRGAEWHFLMGSLYYRRGWVEDAAQYYSTAVQMEPNNAEYRQALSYVNAGGGFSYRPQGYGTPARSGDCDMCDICAAMACANMCCRCG